MAINPNLKNFYSAVNGNLIENDEESEIVLSLENHILIKLILDLSLKHAGSASRRNAAIKQTPAGQMRGQLHRYLFSLPCIQMHA